MDKNNDIQVNKVSKWEAAPDSIKDLRYAINGLFDGLSFIMNVEEGDNSIYTLSGLLAKVLDDYNELEARHQKDTGMISEYEEENRKLKSELDIKTDECDDLISRVLRQDVEYAKLEADHKKLQETHDLCMKAHLRLCDDSTKLATENDDLRQERDKCSYRLEKLGQALEERGIYCRWFEASLEWHLYEGESFEELNRKIQRLEKENKELVRRFKELEKEKIDLEADVRDLEVQASVNASTASTYESELKQVIELAKSYGLIIYDERKDAIPDNVVNISMCGPYYVLVEHDKLLIKYEKLKDENNNLTTDAKRLSDAVNVWFDMFNDMRHKRDFLKKECEKLKETNKSCPVACECENFKPKVHHSYDPLDDLPDMEHYSTEAEIKRVVLDILDHSKPNTCERCRHYDECMDGVFKESVHECCNHYGNYCGAEWDKEKELDKFEKIFAEEKI